MPALLHIVPPLRLSGYVALEDVLVRLEGREFRPVGPKMVLPLSCFLARSMSAVVRRQQPEYFIDS